MDVQMLVRELQHFANQTTTAVRGFVLYPALAFGVILLVARIRARDPISQPLRRELVSACAGFAIWLYVVVPTTVGVASLLFQAILAVTKGSLGDSRQVSDVVGYALVVLGLPILAYAEVILVRRLNLTIAPSR